MMQSEPEQLHKVPSRSNSDGGSKRGLLQRAPTFRAPERMLTQNSFCVFQERVVIAMVGLPARGKSYISKAIVRYLNFLGCPTQLFNAGSLRRKQGLAGTDASFFDPSNKSAQEQRSTVRTCVTGHAVFSQVLVSAGSKGADGDGLPRRAAWLAPGANGDRRMRVRYPGRHKHDNRAESQGRLVRELRAQADHEADTSTSWVEAERRSHWSSTLAHEHDTLGHES